MTTHDATMPVPDVAAPPPSFPGEVFRGPAFQGPPAAPFQGPPTSFPSDPYAPPAGLGAPFGPPPRWTPAPRSRLVTFLAGTAVGAAVLGLVWGGTAALSAASTFDVGGTFQLTQTSSYLNSSYGSFTTGSSCSGSGGYSDIDTGSSVTVYDGSGAVVATGMLGSGRATSSSTCEFVVTVPDVPAGSDFYQVEVSHRGKVTFEGRRLQTDGVSLTLGS
ncbi:hypothetical protein [Pseudonocardia sp. T1-2H]|uniref:hypothetical protein n=1 Tax=Pseudonocardia sp. T1-2H TaxID=3128899 RepID=UPI0031012B6B